VSPLRIVHVLNHVRRTGNGIVTVAVDLACAQAAAGNRVLVISVGGDYESLLSECGVAHERVAHARNLPAVVRTALRFRALLRAFRPNVVHAHMLTGMIHAAAARPGLGYRLVSTVHNVHDRNAALMGLADRVIAVSAAVSRSMAKRGIPARKLRVVANGTIGSRRRRAVGSGEVARLEHPAITTVAGMDKRKGIDILIRAFSDVAAAVPGAHLYIVGDGPDRAAFEVLAAASPAAAHIHFEGFSAEPQCYLQATDIFVLASLADSNPLVLSEAREAGCAIVASAVDGIPEALDGGRAGILVAPGDPAALARQLIDLARDPARIAHWRLQATGELQRLTVDRVCRETIAVYTGA
jgi:glycosyltransferase involved in cell wall biosynthesis